MAQTWQSGQVSVDGINLKYVRSGGDQPPLLCLHGFTDSAACWNRTAAALAETHDVVLLDARGHGLSEKPESGSTLEEHAADVVAVIEALELEQPVLLGHSMGAGTAALVAADHPDLIRALILEDPPWWLDGEGYTLEEWDKVRHIWRRDNGRLKKLSLAEAAAKCASEHPNWHGDDCLAFAESRLQVSLRAFDSFPWHVPWQPTAGRVQCPALLITADTSRGAIVTEACAAALIEMMANCRAVKIEAAGHHIRRDQFDAFLGAVRQFLKEVR